MKTKDWPEPVPTELTLHFTVNATGGTLDPGPMRHSPVSVLEGTRDPGAMGPVKARACSDGPTDEAPGPAGCTPTAT